MSDRVEKNPKDFAVFYNMATNMLYLRFSVLLVPSALIVCLLIVLAISIPFENNEESSPSLQRLEKLPPMPKLI